MNNPINNSVFDSRDLIEHKEYLETELLQMFNDYISEIEEEPKDDFSEIDLNLEGFRNRFEDEISEYEGIAEFCEELSQHSSDFEYGEAIISADYFEDYVREMIEDCGYISKDFPSWIEIDWQETANNVAQDYSEVTYGDESYFIRN